jgi:pimeloyl-ACP methyl ester carboxylesterase
MNHPRLVRGVVVLGGSAKVFPAGTAEALALAADPSKPEINRIEALQKVMFAPGNDPRPWLSGWHPTLREAYRKAGQQPPKDVWFSVSNAPILDLQGDQDPWRPAATRNELKDVLGDKVTVQVIANASHAMIPEQPAAVTDAIVKWANVLGRAPK